MFPKGIKPTSTSTITRIPRLAASAALVVATFCAAASAQSRSSAAPEDIRRSVESLGAEGNDDFAAVRGLAKTPADSVGALIAALHILPHPEQAKAIQDTPAVTHLISCIQALRYITGKDFCATTERKFGHSYEETNRRYWLYFEHSTCLTFFAVWPSRGRFYLAPLDAQQKIISQWQSWYAREGGAYQYPSPPTDAEKDLLCWQQAAGVYSPPRPDSDPCNRPTSERSHKAR